MSRVYASLALMLALCTTGRANEDFCGEIPATELTYEFHHRAGDRTTLVFSMPLQYGKAKFHHVGVALGTGNKSISMRVEVEKSDGRAEAMIHLPRDHELVLIDAIFSEKRCYRTLRVSFANGKLIEPPVKTG